MKEHIYPIPANAIVFPDSTVVTQVKQDAGRFLIVNSDKVLFPEAANSLDAAIELKKALEEMQGAASEDANFTPSLDHVRKFGVQQDSDEVIGQILNRYVNVCREKKAEGKPFGPGVQFNFLGLTSEGINVTFGNYGLFFATLVEASKDPRYKQYLLSQGRQLLGAQHGFFVNLPGTSTVVETADGEILFVNRGSTAEYANMFGQLAAGHHSPERLVKAGMTEIPLDALVAYQIGTETGLTAQNVTGFGLEAIAFSTGSEIAGTEKVEVLTTARMGRTLDEVATSILTNAAQRWETRALYAIMPEQTGRVIAATFDASKPAGSIEAFRHKGLGPEVIVPKTDVNSVSHWVPVHAGALLVRLGRERYEPHLPELWLKPSR